MRVNLPGTASTQARIGARGRETITSSQKTFTKRQSCASTWQEHTSLFLSWETVFGSLKCKPCYGKFEEFAEYQTAEEFALLHSSLLPSALPQGRHLLKILPPPKIP